MRHYFFIFIFIFTLNVCAEENKFVLLPNDKFPRMLLKYINKSHAKIMASIYLISYNQKPDTYVNKILKALINKKCEGVEVEIIINQNSFTYSNSFSNNSFQAYSFLKDAGINIYYDDPNKLNHSKVWVIDERYVFIGSHNISWSAFNKNNEHSLFIDSEKLASELLVDLKNIKKFAPDLPKGEITIPVSFLEDEKLLPLIVLRDDKKSLGTFLDLFAIPDTGVIYLDNTYLNNNFYEFNKFIPSPGGIAQVVQNRFFSKLFNKYPGIFNSEYVSSKNTIKIESLKYTYESISFPELEILNNMKKELQLSELAVILVAMKKTNSLFSGDLFYWYKDHDYDYFPYSRTKNSVNKLCEKGLLLKINNKQYKFSKTFRDKIINSFLQKKEKEL